MCDASTILGGWWGEVLLWTKVMVSGVVGAGAASGAQAAWFGAGAGMSPPQHGNQGCNTCEGMPLWRVPTSGDHDHFKRNNNNKQQEQL